MTKRQFRYMAGDFGFDMVSTGQFTDCGYLVKTYVVRMKGRAINDYILSDFHWGLEETPAFAAKQARRRAEWEEKVLDLLGFRRTPRNSSTITRNVSEIFTIVTMEPME